MFRFTLVLVVLVSVCVNLSGARLKKDLEEVELTKYLQARKEEYARKDKIFEDVMSQDNRDRNQTLAMSIEIRELLADITELEALMTERKIWLERKRRILLRCGVNTYEDIYLYNR